MVTKTSLEEFNDVFLTAEGKMFCFKIHSRQGNFLTLIRYIFSQGARGFSCAISGFSQVLKSDRFRRCLSSAEHVSVCGRRRQSSPSHARRNLWYPWSKKLRFKGEFFYDI